MTPERPEPIRNEPLNVIASESLLILTTTARGLAYRAHLGLLLG